MMQNMMQGFGFGGMGYGAWGNFGVLWSPFFLLVIVWSLFWKGVALWHAAKRGDKGWFVALLILNTVGILEIIYLFAVAKMTADQVFGSAKK